MLITSITARTTGIIAPITLRTAITISMPLMGYMTTKAIA
jgi:hypothetical protein